MTPVVTRRNFNRAKEFQPGDVVDGRYRVLRRLADGGMGTVFLAEHMLIKRRVAIKLLHADLATDRGMVRRFLNEALAAGTIGHPHIVESIDMSFTRDRIPYIVFEYLEGCLLTEEIRRLGRLPVRRTLLIGRQIASALEAAHGAQIAHLDLKSDNVFLTSRGDAPDHAKLLDFGISRFMAADDDPVPSDLFMGTPEFMAPEQVTHPALADCRADIYSLGVVLYEMLAGRCPFASSDSRSVLDRVIQEPPPPLGRLVPRALDCLVFDGLLVKSPRNRIQSMTEILAILDALLAAMRPWSSEVLPVFEESTAKLSAPLDLPSPTIAPVESWFDNEPPRLEAPPWETEVWP
jgi:serine/threonine-protein kinase